MMKIYNNAVYSNILTKIKKQPLLPNGTRELIDVYLEFNVHERLSIANKKYIQAELEWYKSQKLNINEHPTIAKNPIWKGCAAEDGSVNSNYGWCNWSDDNYSQYEHAKQSLLKDPYTRQSCCIYARPEMQKIHNDGVHAKKDFICTFCTQHLIRNGKLEYLVYMRSNDIIHGLPYDLAWHQHVYSNLFSDLIDVGIASNVKIFKELMPGIIRWHASSLHKYEEIENELEA